MAIQPIQLTSIDDAVDAESTGSCCGGGSCAVSPAVSGDAAQRRPRRGK